MLTMTANANASVGVRELAGDDRTDELPDERAVLSLRVLEMLTVWNQAFDARAPQIET